MGHELQHTVPTTHVAVGGIHHGADFLVGHVNGPEDAYLAGALGSIAFDKLPPHHLPESLDHHGHLQRPAFHDHPDVVDPGPALPDAAGEKADGSG
jgi:hypothetical protein